MPLLANKSRVQFLPDRAPYEYKLGREIEHGSLARGKPKCSVAAD